MATTVPCRIGQIPAAASIGKQKRIRRSPPLPFPHLPPRLRSRLRRNTAWSRLPVPLGKPKRLLSPPAGFLSCGMSPIICPALSLALRPPLQNSLALPWRACSSAPESPPNATRTQPGCRRHWRTRNSTFHPADKHSPDCPATSHGRSTVLPFRPYQRKRPR